jgi:predicted AAA+ superfamily ATPase
LLTASVERVIFETFVVSECVKTYLHRGREPDLTYWRDAAGHEVDLIIDDGKLGIPVEIKAGETVADDFANGLEYWRKLAGAPVPAAVVYAGDRSFVQRGIAYQSWQAL